MGNIFINYRRDDEPGFVHALYGQLERSFPSERLFMDVDSIPYGKDFVEVLDENVSQCKVLLAVIGKDWLGPKNEQGQDTRLSDPNDFVRLEIASALSRNIPVIPVLMNKAEIPLASVLPDDLKPLTRRNAIRISHDRFRSDMERLTTRLRDILGKESSAAKHETQKSKKQSSWLGAPIGLTLAALALLMVVGMGYFFTKPAQYQLIKTVEEPDSYNFAVSNNRKFFATIGSKIQIWLSETGRKGSLLSDKEERLYNVSFSPGAKFILTGGCKSYKNYCQQGEAKLWDIASRLSLYKIENFKSEVRAVAFSSDGKSFFITGCSDYDEDKSSCINSSLKQFETSSGTLIEQFLLKDVVYTITVHPNGKFLFLGGSDYSIKQVNLETKQVIPKFNQANMGSTYTLAISTLGNTLVSGEGDGKIRIWDMQHADPKQTLEGHQRAIRSVDISPDGSKILSTSEDRTVRVWDAKSGKLLQKIEGFGKDIIYASFIDEGNKFISVESLSKFKIWGLKSW